MKKGLCRERNYEISDFPPFLFIGKAYFSPNFQTLSAIYSFLISVVAKVLPLFAWINPKMKLFVSGRKSVFEQLQQTFSASNRVIWFHAASLGEYEQGVPVIEAVKKDFPDHKILLTFFSPSGYAVKKNNTLAHCTTYLPLDTKKNVRKFLALARPEMAIFIKYEIWPNYLEELKSQKVTTLLISGLFRKNQVFFKPYGGFMRNALKKFDQFFVQDETSLHLLKKIGITNITLAGDTRFDRVSQQIEQDNTLDFISEFKHTNLCMVCGSTWPEDEQVLISLINSSSEKVKFIIAPHEIHAQKIEHLQKQLQKKTILYSEKSSGNLADYQVLIMDTIGLLTRTYSYADLAYVGGAMGTTGLHNILEPATFGVPIIIGENFDKFPEAKKLQQLAGLFSVGNSAELKEITTKLVRDANFRKHTGMISGHFIQSNTGATKKIMAYITLQK